MDQYIKISALFGGMVWRGGGGGGGGGGGLTLLWVSFNESPSD